MYGYALIFKNCERIPNKLFEVVLCCIIVVSLTVCLLRELRVLLSVAPVLCRLWHWFGENCDTLAWAE